MGGRVGLIGRGAGAGLDRELAQMINARLSASNPAASLGHGMRWRQRYVLRFKGATPACERRQSSVGLSAAGLARAGPCAAVGAGADGTVTGAAAGGVSTSPSRSSS